MKNTQVIAMFKYFIILLFVGIVASCSGNDDSNDTILVDFQDNDGDGVANTIEQNAGTDPNDGCSFSLSQQEFAKTTEAWRGQDCDGDGVTNGNEIDPDGNEINDGNGTDPLEVCDFVVSQQNVNPSNEWLAIDCDNDCKTNEEEIADGTDPTDENDFVGSGDAIAQVISYNLDGIPYTRYFFEENGSRIVEIKSGNDITLYEYVYQNNLIKEIHTFDEQGFSVTDVIFEYTGNQISSISKDYIGNLDEYSVVYSGNKITAHSIHEPPGLFWRQIEFDPSMENIIKSEWYRNSNSDYIYRVTDYTYDALGNRTGYSSEEMGYDPDTGDYYPIGNFPITGKTYEYSETVLNPMYEAYKSLEVAAFLSQYGLNSPLPSSTSPNLCTYYLYDLGYDQVEYRYEADCVQSNGKPVEVTYIDQYDNRFLRKLIYE